MDLKRIVNEIVELVFSLFMFLCKLIFNMFHGSKKLILTQQVMELS